MDRNDERAAVTAAVARDGEAKRTWTRPTLHKLPLQNATLTSSHVSSDGISYS